MPNIIVNSSITLPPDMVWVDEFTWDVTAKTETLSVTGTPIVQGQSKTAGRRISLESGSDFGYVQRSALNALLALRSSATDSFTLVLGDGRSFDVQFAPSSENTITATPVQPGKNPADTDLYSVKLKFMEN